jgi:spermidine/putrescine transport system substrate-binding protein
VSVGGLSRRSLLGLGALGAGGLALAACGAGGAASEGAPSSASALASVSASALLDPVLRFSNWPAYIDVSEDGSATTLDDFRAAGGIDVEYTEDINDGSEFYAKVRTQLEAGEDIGRDLLVFSEETARVFIEEGFAAPLDYALIPNASNLLPRLREAAFDPGRRYTLPWQSGFTGFGWNTPLLQERLGVPAVTSFEQFFDPRLAGRIAILSETMDTMGLLLAWQGFDPSHFSDDEFEQALAVLQGYVDDGTIRQVAGNDYISGLDSGDLVASIGWSGDVLALGDDFGFGLPESGGLVWADSLIVPSVSTHQANAARLIDFYYDPAVAARLAAYIQYVCPVEGAREAMAAVDPTLVDDPWIFPPASVLDAAYVTENLSMARSEALDRRFDSVLMG